MEQEFSVQELVSIYRSMGQELGYEYARLSVMENHTPHLAKVIVSHLQPEVTSSTRPVRRVIFASDYRPFASKGQAAELVAETPTSSQVIVDLEGTRLSVHRNLLRFTD